MTHKQPKIISEVFFPGLATLVEETGIMKASGFYDHITNIREGKKPGRLVMTRIRDALNQIDDEFLSGLKEKLPTKRFTVSYLFFE